MKRALFYVGLMWKPVLLTILALAIAIFILTYKLSTLAPGYSPEEVNHYYFVKDLSNIINKPINAPLNLIQYGLINFIGNGLIWLRVASAFYTLVAALAFYSVAVKWYTNRIAFLASTMFISSTWLLVTGRTGVPSILLCLLGLLIAVYFWLSDTKKKKTALLIFTLCIVLLAYIPGGIVFMAAGIAWKGKSLISQVKKVPILYVLACLITGLLLLIPLALAGLKDKQIAMDVLGITNIEFSLTTYASNLWNNFTGLFVSSYRITGSTLGKTATLDVFSITMICAGILVAARKFGQDKMKYMILGLIGSFLLAGLGGAFNITLMMPFIYILIATGLAWMLRQWLAVFPRNPIARNIGVTILVACVGISVLFNTYRYFVAWPYMPKTKATYNQKI